MDLLEQHNGELNGPVRYPTLQSKRRAEDGVPESLFGKCPVLVNLNIRRFNSKI